MKSQRNLWPWAIITAFGLFISGTVGLVVMACAQHVDLVRSDYYEEELRFQGRIDSLKRAQELTRQATVAYDGDHQRITLSLPPEHAGHTVTGKIQLYRPAAAGMDRELSLAPGPGGLQVLDAAGMAPGLWRVRVTWTLDNKDYFADQKLVITAKTP